jgi:hypothetical protein
MSDENDEPVELSDEEINLALDDKDDPANDRPEELTVPDVTGRAALRGEEPGPVPLIVVVIGSTTFDEPFAVQSVLLGWGQRHADHPIYLWTSGAPEGAEAQAKIFANANGWQTVDVQPETLLGVDEAAVTFAFVTPGSRAAEFAADIAQRRPVRQLTLETLRPRSRWNEW